MSEPTSLLLPLGWGREKRFHKYLTPKKMGSITVLRIDCIYPSTGIASWWESGVGVAIDAFCTTLGGAIGGAAGGAIGGGVVTAATSAITALTGPAAVIIIPADLLADAAGVATGASIGAWVGGTGGLAIGKAVSAAADAGMEYIGQGIRDQVYLEADGKAVWPSGSGLLTPTVDMNSGDGQVPNLEIPFGDNGQVTLKLKE